MQKKYTNLSTYLHSTTTSTQRDYIFFLHLSFEYCFCLSYSCLVKFLKHNIAFLSKELIDHPMISGHFQSQTTQIERLCSSRPYNRHQVYIYFLICFFGPNESKKCCTFYTILYQLYSLQVEMIRAFLVSFCCNC